ncbi:hypothetical protein PENSPDRAFT_647840 [Peniophora sp. CONT]|nr:hypothetical protein PENSPDRAFT_647840 [Peniophora sp. CONT]
MPIYDGGIDTTSKHPGMNGAEYITEPFILAAPVHSRSLEKGSSQQHTALLCEPESLNNGASTTPLRSPSPPISDTTIAPPRPAIGDTDALQALERSLMLERRRLDDLIESLANRGETESNPPEYEGDGNVTNYALARDERV